VSVEFNSGTIAAIVIGSLLAIVCLVIAGTYMYYSDVFAGGPTGLDASWVMSQYHKQQMATAIDSSDQATVRGVLANPVFNKFKGGGANSSSNNSRGGVVNSSPRAGGNQGESFDGANPMAPAASSSSSSSHVPISTNLDRSSNNDKNKADLYDVYDT